MPYRPRVERFPHGVVVSLHGELDAYQAPDLHSAFAEVADEARGAVVVLDATAVTFLDSTALGAIVGLVRRQRESGGELRVVLPETAARRIFELTGLDGVLDVRASRAEAVAG